MAHKKGQGSTRNGRDSDGQRRGVKMYAGETAQGGQHPRASARHPHPSRPQRRHGRDYTLFALIDGIVQYERMGKDRRRVNVEPKPSA